MKTLFAGFISSRVVVVALVGIGGVGSGPRAEAQTPARFNSIQVLTNREVSFNVSNAPLRIDAAESLGAWKPLVTFTPAASSITFTDTAAPYILNRFYRAEAVAATNLAGDHLVTDDGDVVIRPINHASVVLRWKDRMIYNDPVGGATPFAGLPRADLILVGHTHGDHFNGATIDQVRGSNAVLVVPQVVYNSLSVAQRAFAVVLTNGGVTTAHGMTIEAVPAYNLTTMNHLKETPRMFRKYAR
jgi:hypothetical protein